MSQQIRREVLKAFKNLHRTCEYVFGEDQHAVAAAKVEINSNFRKSRELSDEQEIKKLVQFAKDVENELRTNVVQAVEREAGVYELHIREEVPRLENTMFNPDAVIEKPRRGGAKCGGAPQGEKS